MKSAYLTLGDGTRLFARLSLEKSAPTLLLFHGGPGNGIWDWAPLLERLEQTVNFVAFDQRGVNRSDAVGEGFSSERLIDDAEEVRKTLHLGKIVPVGHSYGGHLALRYLKKYPQSAEKAVFIGPSFHFANSLQTVVARAAERLKESAPELAEQISSLGQKGDFPSLFSALSTIPEQTQNEVYGFDRIPASVTASLTFPTEEEQRKSAAHQGAVFAEEEIHRDWTGTLAGVSCPSLLLVGRFDPVCPEEQINAFREKVPHGRTVILPESGHFPYTDAVAKTAEEIERFVLSEN